MITIFEKLFKNEARPTSTVSNPEEWLINLMGGVNSGESVVTPQLAMNLSSVSKCLAIRSGTISKMPLQVFRNKGKGSERVHDKVSELLETRPNRIMTPSQFKKQISIDIDLWGNAYVLIVDDRKELRRMEPYRVVVDLMTDGSLRYTYNDPVSGKTAVHEDGQVMHFKEMTTDGYIGKSKIQMARETVGNARSAGKLLSQYYKNGTLTKGFLTSPDNLGPTAKETIKSEWQKANAGLKSAFKIPVIDRGLEYHDISMSFQDAEFLNMQKFTIEEIGRFFNVPPYKLGVMDGAKFNNVQSQEMDFISNSIQPLITDIEEEIKYKLFYTAERKKGYFVKFNMAVAMRADDLTRASFYEKMKRIGAYNINEIREKENKDNIGALGEIYWGDLNSVPIEIMKEYQLGKAGGDTDNENVKNTVFEWIKNFVEEVEHGNIRIKTE